MYRRACEDARCCRDGSDPDGLSGDRHGCEEHLLKSAPVAIDLVAGEVKEKEAFGYREVAKIG